MSNEVKHNVPDGLVRKMTTRWKLNEPDINDVDSSNQTPTPTNSSRGLKRRKTIPQLQNNFFKEILCRTQGGEPEVAGFTVKQEHEGSPSQTSTTMTVDVLATDHSHVNFILKSIKSSPEAKVRR
jgi:hypothetical protein